MTIPYGADMAGAGAWMDEDGVVHEAEVPWPDEEPPADLDAHRAARQPAPQAERIPMRDRLLSVFDLSSLPPVTPLVDGFLYRGTLAQLSGPPGSYKSFLMVAWAVSVAAGEDFEGHHVPARGDVVIVAPEGAQGLQARIFAYCEASGIDPNDVAERIHILPAPVQIGNRVDIADALDAVQHLDAALLVLDTRARCTVGLEENSAKEQGLAIAGAELLAAGGCTVLALHHSGRNGGAGRGSNSWDGAVWSDLRITSDGEAKTATVECFKHKDVQDGCEHVFRLVPHTVDAELMPGRDEKARSTLIAAAADLRNFGLQEALFRSPSRKKILELVRNSAPDEGLTNRKIVDLAIEAKIAESTAYECVKSLITAGALVNVSRTSTRRFVASTAYIEPTS
ncbi:AAA family ATPase [Pseudonocardia benzenivorans]|uniref:AAA family ATPase n=1 Tax=Pseudonocardia benzenivorans TaxID=228005 RepID=A0ABW3VH45_9PSEU